MDRFRDHDILLSCMTAAGRATLEQLYGGSVRVVYLPYDLPGAAARFLAHFRPRLAVLLETEVWPNLLAACARARLPVVLASARLSEKSRAGYARWPGLMRPAFESLAAACAQSDADATRLAALGARDVRVCGNLKFDVVPDADKLEAGRAEARALAGRRVILFASTREGEERLLFDALREARGDWLAVVVPRHPQRFDEVAELARSALPRIPRRSRGERAQPADRALLGDTLGEMAFYYGLADVAVIGGSFLPLGGQNLIEACAAGVPVVVGPHMFNFAEATRLAVAAGAAREAADMRAALAQALELLANPAQLARMGEAGLQLCAAHRGATQRHLEVCAALLRGPARG
jgi:3-deoxy-D-manno-octulosonic-acid transferase